MKVLFIGDIVGLSGQDAISNYLQSLKQEHKPQLTIANGENLADGHGITEKLYKWLLSQGVDAVTLGNHSFDNRNIYEFIDTAKCLVRPVNLPNSTPGKGIYYVNINQVEVAIINVLGNVFMNPALDSFDYLERIIPEVKKRTNHIIIDLHAETTSEKQAIAHWLDGKVSAVIGTHTHVQTNDARVLANGTAYLTDVGMTGALNGVLGFRKEDSIQRFRSKLPTRIEQAIDSGLVFSACIIDIDNKTGLAKSIKPIYIENE